MGRLDGKTTLITGGTEGMRFATAQEFVAEGAFVFVTGRRQAQVDKAAAKLGENAHGIAADAGKGPRINVLSPGPIDTEGFRRETNDDPRIRDATVGMVPIGRMGEPREIGRAAVFLASDDSSFCAGGEFFIDGGVASV